MFPYRSPVAWIVLILLLMMLIGMIDDIFKRLGWIQAGVTVHPGSAAPVIPGSAPGSAAASGPATPGSASGTSAASLASAQADAARTELSSATKLLTEAAASADKALEQISVWTHEIEPLRENSDGQLIAAHADLAKQIAFLFQQPRTSKADLNSARERIDFLRNETERLKALNPPLRLTPEQSLEVQELHRRAGEASSVWADAVVRARAIAREAQRKAPPTPVATVSGPPISTPQVASATPAAPPPTAQPPSDSASAPASAPATGAESSTSPAPPSPIAASAQEPPQPKGSTLQAKVEEIIDKNQIDALNDQIAKEAERKRKEAERLDEQRKLAEQLAAQKAKLVAEARSEEVQRVLQPLLVRRNIQPRLAGASLQWRQTVDQQPMSFSALESVGALAETVQGLSTLARVGSHRELSSPRWEFGPSPRTWSSDTQDRLKQAQDLLRRLGPTLVEQGLLSP